jgi:hypothetical protein
MPSGKRRTDRLPMRIGCTVLVAAGFFLPAMADVEAGMAKSVDPVTRHLHIRYPVPADAPDEVAALCSWSPPAADAWRPAKVMANISETGLNYLPGDVWLDWVEKGRVVERRAAGLERTVIFNPYPEAQANGLVDVDFRVEIQSLDGTPLATHQARVQADNSDVFYLEEWSKVFQSRAVAIGAEPEGAQWAYRTAQDPSSGTTLGNALYGDAGPTTPLPRLSCPLDLRGHYAVFVCTPGAIRLRLTGDERTDGLSSRRFEEVLWRWTRMDRQNLVLKQPYRYTGYSGAAIDYVKFVPLSSELVEELDGQFGEPDKLVAGYWEPYSWAFHENVQETIQHREPLSAFRDARIGIVDTQIGRFGMKVVYETRESDPLLYATRGDPIGTVAQPETDNVGRMQQFTNTLDATLRYARAFGFRAHANFGASNCYPGSPLQGDFSKAHPEWMRKSALRYEVPEVRAYVLALYREALEIGARGLSIDFCRYPETIDSAETGNLIMEELRALADEFSEKDGERVTIMTRFPGTGVRRHELFDYATWAREGWVDYLCPSNIQGRHLHIDMAPYREAVKGTKCTLLPAFDGLSWGQMRPGPFLWRAAELYEAGADGIYVYQADSRVLGRPVDRRFMRLLASSDGVRNYRDAHVRARPGHSKGIYISTPNHIAGWHGWERLRVWTEGVEMGELEIHLDGEPVSHWDGPPYLAGTEEYDSDGVIPPGKHELLIRARDGEGWLEQTITIQGAG